MSKYFYGGRKSAGSKSDALHYFCSLNLNPCNRFAKSARARNAPPRPPPSPLRQTYAPASPNRCPLRNHSPCHAAPTPDQTCRCLRPPRFRFNPRGRCRTWAPPWLSRRGADHYFPWQHFCALASARCPFFLKLTFSPQRGAISSGAPWKFVGALGFVK